jgi:hypothetical protein
LLRNPEEVLVIRKVFIRDKYPLDFDFNYSYEITPALDAANELLNSYRGWIYDTSAGLYNRPFYGWTPFSRWEISRNYFKWQFRFAVVVMQLLTIAKLLKFRLHGDADGVVRSG